MDGVAAILTLLIDDSGVSALVPAGRIMGGVLPQGTALPALGVTSVARMDRHTLARGARTMCRERVQVSVFAPDYGSQKEISRAVVAACDAKFPVVDGIENVTVHTESAGPDFMAEDSSIHIGTQDFAVTWSEAR